MQRTSAFVVAVAAVVLGAVAQARADDIVIFNTGVGADGHVLAPGSSDPHYQLVSRPAGAPEQAVVANAHFAYIQNDAVGSSGSSWICESAETDDFHELGDYVYRTTFDLTGLDPATATLSGEFANDDSMSSMRLNGNTVGATGGQFVAFAPFSINSGFVAGVNTLEFTVFNGGGEPNPHGLRLVISGTASPIVVEPPVDPPVEPDVTAPSILGCADVTFEFHGAAISLSAADLGITAVDDVDGPVGVTLNPTSVSGLGAHTVTVTAMDAAGNGASATFVVTLVDTTAPVFTSLSISHSVLTTPNHKMVHLVVSANATDSSGAAPTVRIADVTCNEASLATGSGSTSQDWVITGDLTLDLRAERSGSGDGRIYTITVECTDASGNVTLSTLTVTVPHDRR